MSRKDQHILFNPYPGLRPFGVQESHLYFGREGQSEEILRLLSKNRFATILGSSGTGKSSLMFSGVIPTLFGGHMADAGASWEILTTRPGLQPIKNLAEAFAHHELHGLQADEVEETINHQLYHAIQKRSPKGILEAYNISRRLKGKNLLIYFDQFEEIFRFRRQGSLEALNESLAYVHLILETIRQKELPIYIALSMRSDFLGECEQFPELTNEINESHYLIPQMTRNQKKLVIEGPAAIFGAQFTERLIQRLLNDMGDKADQLPILQHALMRTWTYWSQNSRLEDPIDLMHYEAIGGVNEALSRHADEAYLELDQEQKIICERLFKTITEKRNDNDGIRRPTRLKDIAQILDEDIEAITPVIDLFRQESRALLTPPADQELTPDSVIDISHEALMRVWYRLRNWVEEESQSSRTYLRLTEAALLFHKGSGDLWRPPDLQLAVEWRNSVKPTLKWALQYSPHFEAVIDFLNRSEDAYNTEIETKERLQRSRLRRSRIIAYVLGSAAVVSVLVLFYALNQQKIAEKQRQIALSSSKEARENANTAERNRLKALDRLKEANLATQKANLQKERAENNAKEAQLARKNAEKQRIIAENQTQVALKNINLANQQTEVANKERKNAENSEKRSEMLRMVTLAGKLAVKSKQVDDPQLEGILSYLAYQFNTNNQGDKYDNDIYNGLFYAMKTLNPSYFEAFNGLDIKATRLVMSSNNTLISNGDGGRILKWDITNPGNRPELLFEKKNELVRRLCISDDKGIIAWINEGSDFYIYDVQHDQLITELSIPTSYAYDLKFIPGSRDLLISGNDSTVYKYNFKNISPLVHVKGQAYTIMPYKNNGVVVGTNSGRIDYYNFSTPQQPLEIFKQNGSEFYSLAHNNDQIVFGDQSGHIWLLTLDSTLQVKQQQTLSGHNKKIVSDLAFNPTYNLVISSNTGGTIRIWDLQNPDDFPVLISEPETWILSIGLFNKDQIYASCKEKSMRNYPLFAKKLADDLRKYIKRDIAPDEWKRYIGSDIPYEPIFNDNTLVHNE